MDVSRVGVRVPLGADRVRAVATRVLAAERCRAAMIAITFVDERTIARLNRRHVGHSGATDIVTLEHTRGPGGVIVGDVYIAPAVARANAHAAGHGVREELARLTVHGVLHALGWTHPEDDRRTRSPMWRRQESLLGAAKREGVI